MTTYHVSGMHCGTCAGKIATAVRAVPAVSSAVVDLKAGTLLVEGPASFDSVRAAVRSAGTYDLAQYSATRAAISFLKRTAPLWTMFGVVIAFVLVRAWYAGMVIPKDMMMDFMAGFFLLFGGLKVVNLRNFARMYSGYDILAKRVPAWSFAYPFIEVSLGLCYLTGSFLTSSNVIAIVIMLFGCVGIFQKLRGPDDVTCACLGGFFSVPLTYITLAENLLMAAMAAVMLVA